MSYQQFLRRDVLRIHVPEYAFDEIAGPPGFAMFGTHYFIMLHDHNSMDVPSRSAVVCPITSAKAEVNRAVREGRSITPCYVPINNKDHPFLHNDTSYAATHQIISVNREWITSHDLEGTIQPDKMFEIDFGIIRTEGLIDTVNKIALTIVEQKARLLQDPIKLDKEA